MFNITNKKQRAVIFAGYSYNGCLYPDVPAFLEELKKYTDYLIYVSDNSELEQSSIETVARYANKIILGKHNKYDFGSYQAGFNYLYDNKTIYDNLEQIFFCNDSIIYQGQSLESFFKKGINKDFYGLTWHAYGFYRNVTESGISYPWAHLPHIQSFLFSVSKEIANKEFFRNFINNIEIEKCKDDIIAKYEIGLSQLISSNGYELHSYYPKVDASFEPCGYFLSDGSSYKEPRLFIKRRPVAPISLAQDIYTEEL